MIAGPRKRPRSWKLSTPPRMTNKTHRNGSFVAPPISFGLTKWSAKKMTAKPAKTTKRAGSTPFGPEQNGGGKTTRQACREGNHGRDRSSHPKQDRVRRFGDNVNS